MMYMYNKFGDPTFPCVDEEGGKWPGITMREWYAGMALQGILANPDQIGRTPNEHAKIAFEFADAMCAQAQQGGSS